jgi:hypothetical protein
VKTPAGADFITNDEESSGIIDASEFVGREMFVHREERFEPKRPSP